MSLGLNNLVSVTIVSSENKHNRIRICPHISRNLRVEKLGQNDEKEALDLVSRCLNECVPNSYPENPDEIIKTVTALYTPDNLRKKRQKGSYFFCAKVKGKIHWLSEFKIARGLSQFEWNYDIPPFNDDTRVLEVNMFYGEKTLTGELAAVALLDKARIFLDENNCRCIVGKGLLSARRFINKLADLYGSIETSESCPATEINPETGLPVRFEIIKYRYYPFTSTLVFPRDQNLHISSDTRQGFVYDSNLRFYKGSPKQLTT